MHEIDLIPADYRRQLQRNAEFARFLAVFVVLNVLVLAVAATLAHLAGEQREVISRLQSQNAITQQQSAQLRMLDEELAEHQSRWTLLRGLRAGAAVDDVFLLIDRSIRSGDLWFLDWTFRRAGVIVDGQPRAVETGYFIILGEDNDLPPDADLSVETRMTIHGQATDHQALSSFVRTLFEQQHIKDVSVQRTTQTEYATGKVVDFSLTVLLNTAHRDS